MKSLKVPLILMLATFLASALLTISEFSTREEIERQKKLVLINSLRLLIPAELHDNDLTTSTVMIAANNELGLRKDTLAYIGSQNGEPSVIALPVTSHNGYSGDIEILVGIKMDGSITTVKILEQHETPGLGDLILASKSDWIRQLFGASLKDPKQEQWKVKKDGGNFDQITGATISPRAVVGGVKSALIYHQKNKHNYKQWLNPHE